MTETISASLANTVVYWAFAAGLIVLYRKVIPHAALLWLVGALFFADDSIIYHWLAKQDTLIAELLAVVMGMLCALFTVKAAMVVFRSQYLVPVTAFLTLPLSMTAVMLFHDPALYPWQLALSQFAFALPFAEATVIAWKTDKPTFLSKTLVAVFGGLALIYIARVVYVALNMGNALDERAFLASDLMKATLVANSVLVATGLIAIVAMIVRAHVADKRQLRQQSAAA